jgi:hypothetical protein
VDALQSKAPRRNTPPGVALENRQAVLLVRSPQDDWRAWREVRLAALADAPGPFASSLEAAGELIDDSGQLVVVVTATAQIRAGQL